MDSWIDYLMGYATQNHQPYYYEDGNTSELAADHNEHENDDEGHPDPEIAGGMEYPTRNHQPYYYEDGDTSELAADHDEHENNDEGHPNPEIASGFSTDMAFGSREDLINWVQKRGRVLGYVMVIKRSRTKVPTIIFQCDRGGTYEPKKESSKNTGTRKTGCPFEMEGKYMRSTDSWRVRVTCEAHNHDPAIHLEGHPYARRLSANEVQLVENLVTMNVKPRDILSSVKRLNPDNVSTSKTIYNARQKIRTADKAGKTQMQVVMSFLSAHGYVHDKRENNATKELEDLFFIHPKSLEKWRAFPHILLIDATYKTNRYSMPLVEMVGVTSTNRTFCIAFAFMHKEDESNYTWALNCLKGIIEGCITPRVIVTDRELALMKACKNVYPDAKGLLCRWHINRSILRKCKPAIPSSRQWDLFYQSWNALIQSQTYEIYAFNLAHLKVVLHDFPGVFGYIDDNWLRPYKEMFVSVWIDQFLTFGNTTTNRVESQHAKLKRYLESTRSDLETSLLFIDKVIDSQDTSVRASLEESRTVIRHRFNTSHFQELRGFVSIHALELIYNEFERSKADGFIFENCGCRLRASFGLPCAHEQVTYSRNDHPIPLDSVDIFWRKLDLSPSIPLNNEDFGCENELHIFKDQFKKQSRAGRFNILRKLREMITPSTTLTREPAVQINIRGRPTSKNKSLRKNQVDQTMRTQHPGRNSCSAASRFVEPNVSRFQEPARNSCSAVPGFTGPNVSQFQETGRKSCSVRSRFAEPNVFQCQEPTPRSFYSSGGHSFHPYTEQLPDIFHPYISQVQDVRSDGNCGFRAIAMCLGFPEDEWSTIRYNLIEELEFHKNEYIQMFSPEGWYGVYNSLNFFEMNRIAPIEHWMTMPEMGILIASRYNVILHVLNIAGSMTYLPLRSNPPPWYEHIAIAIGYVNNNHYVKVTLSGGYPMPTVVSYWTHNRYPCADAWITPYLSRINTYTTHLLSNCNNRDHVMLE